MKKILLSLILSSLSLWESQALSTKALGCKFHNSRKCVNPDHFTKELSAGCASVAGNCRYQFCKSNCIDLSKSNNPSAMKNLCQSNCLNPALLARFDQKTRAHFYEIYYPNKSFNTENALKAVQTEIDVAEIKLKSVNASDSPIDKTKNLIKKKKNVSFGLNSNTDHPFYRNEPPSGPNEDLRKELLEEKCVDGNNRCTFDFCKSNCFSDSVKKGMHSDCKKKCMTPDALFYFNAVERKQLYHIFFPEEAIIPAVRKDKTKNRKQLKIKAWAQASARARQARKIEEEVVKKLKEAGYDPKHVIEELEQDEADAHSMVRSLNAGLRNAISVPLRYKNHFFS